MVQDPGSYKMDLGMKNHLYTASITNWRRYWVRHEFMMNALYLKILLPEYLITLIQPYSIIGTFYCMGVQWIARNMYVWKVLNNPFGRPTVRTRTRFESHDRKMGTWGLTLIRHYTLYCQLVIALYKWYFLYLKFLQHPVKGQNCF